jgi:hypothetical protein
MTIDFDEFEKQFKELNPERDEKVEAMKDEIMAALSNNENQELLEVVK